MRTLCALIGTFCVMSLVGCENPKKFGDREPLDELHGIVNRIIDERDKALREKQDCAIKIEGMKVRAAVELAKTATETLAKTTDEVIPVSHEVNVVACIFIFGNESEHRKIFVCKKECTDGSKCLMRSVQTVDDRGDQMITESDIRCSQYDQYVVLIAKAVNHR